VRGTALAAALLVVCGAAAAGEAGLDPREVHLANIRQLTFEGENAEGYWSPDGKQIIFQSKHGTMGCDQIFVMNADGSGAHLVSTGGGRTTCSYFFPAGDRILFSSTHAASAECPPRPDYSKGYVWPGSTPCLLPRKKPAKNQRPSLRLLSQGKSAATTPALAAAAKSTKNVTVRNPNVRATRKMK